MKILTNVKLRFSKINQKINNKLECFKKPLTVFKSFKKAV